MSKWARPDFYQEKKYNIVYQTTIRVGDLEYYYIGKHSTNVLEDGYLGSGPKFRKFLKDHPDSVISRKILSTWNTVEEALLEEERVVTLGMLRDPLCLNSIRGGGSFDTTGRVPSQEERENQSRKLKGHKSSEKQKQAVSAKLKGRQSPTKGKVWVSLKGDRHLVDPENLQNWLEAGYVRGLPESAKQGVQNFHKNSVWVHRGEESKIIRKEDLGKYLDQGFEEGRVIGRGKKVWMKKGGESSRMVKIEEIQKFEQIGWVKGRV